MKVTKQYNFKLCIGQLDFTRAAAERIYGASGKTFLWALFIPVEWQENIHKEFIGICGNNCYIILVYTAVQQKNPTIIT